MVFTGFPTETFAEAMETISLLEELRDSISLFMCGEFALTSGSRVARDPAAFGLKEVWTAKGDEFKTGLFSLALGEQPGEEEREWLTEALETVSGYWKFGSYPWAGSLSTAHTQLWYERFTADIFRTLAEQNYTGHERHARKNLPSHYDPYELEEISFTNEGNIWFEMVYRLKEVSRELYDGIAARMPHVRGKRKKRLYRE